MKIAVTGSSGFLGSHLMPAVAGAGHLVTGITEPGLGFSETPVGSVSADILSEEGLSAAMGEPDGVIHLAARNHVLKETEKDPLSAYRAVNVEGTRNVIRAAVAAGARWFIHFSSVKVMGEGSDSILDENTSCAPLTPYGISKLESEFVVRQIAEESGLRAVIFRLPMAYGPYNRGNLLRMIRWADRGYPFPLFHPDNLRSMIYAENVVSGVLSVIEKAPDGISTYILKDREDYSTRTVYSAICRELGKPARFFSIPSPMARLGGLLSEDFRKVTGSFRVSAEKIEKELGFFPPVSLEEGIARTVDWYKHSARSRSA